jgi:hypothetical protein
MILLYQVGKWVAANFKSLQSKLWRLFFVGGMPPIFYAAKAAESSLRSRLRLDYLPHGDF